LDFGFEEGKSRVWALLVPLDADIGADFPCGFNPKRSVNTPNSSILKRKKIELLFLISSEKWVFLSIRKDKELDEIGVELKQKKGGSWKQGNFSFFFFFFLCGKKKRKN
jgi:hypothetical protein